MRVEDGRLVLARAAAQAGGIAALAAEINVSERVLRQYIEGKEPVPDGLFLKVVDVILKKLPELKVWRVGTLREWAMFKAENDRLRSVAFSPDSKTLAALSSGGYLELRSWDLVTGREKRVTLEGYRGPVMLAFSPDGKFLASRGHSATVRLWEVGSVAGRPEDIELWVQVITGMQLAPDGRIRHLDPAAWRARYERLHQLGLPTGG